MNEEYFKWAVDKINNMSLSEIEKSLIDAGLFVKRKITGETDSTTTDKVDAETEEYAVPEFKREYRLYSFVMGLYLSPIQHGIQTGHAAVDIVRKYSVENTQYRSDILPNSTEMVVEWADNHKTFIILNVNNFAGLTEAAKLCERSGYPFTTFYEDEQSLNGLMTCVSVVLPDDIFNAKRDTNIHGETFYHWTRKLDDGTQITYYYREDDPEFALVDFLKSAKLV